jgi:hypothetical protein
MASNEYLQVTTVINRLGELASMLNPVKLVTTVAEVIGAIREPPPGDPDALEQLAAAYRDAAADLRALCDTAGRAPRAFTEAADALGELAAAMRAQRRRHAELHQALDAANHDLTHVGTVPMFDPTALDDVARAVTGLIRGCITVYTASLDAADRAASRFADLTGQARAAAAVSGGFAPAEAIMLADQLVSVPTIGDAYDDGILSPAQLRRAGERRRDLGPADRAALDGLLDRAGSDPERAWLYKALAAGHEVPALAAFANTIRGQDPTWLDGHLSLIDRGGIGEQDRLGTDIRQYEDTTCGTTALIVARAEADPLYALSLTQWDLPASFRTERARVHDETNLLWPEALGTLPAGMADYLTEHVGTKYGWRTVDDTDPRDISAALRDVVTAADRGHPAPVLVGGPVPRHYVLVVGHSDGDILIFEPTRGRTLRVPEPDFLNGKLTGTAGFDHVQAIVLPA